ncbi:MAG: heme lyase CcmF/NrfE family subunit, partial [Gammaproteobacteria bacterium]
IGYIGYFLLLIGLMNCIILLTPKLVSDLNISSEILFSASKAHFPIILLSFLCLIVTFVGEDYSLDYVAKNSNSNLPLIYKISAAWAGHEGSMLLWCVVSSFWMFLASYYSKNLSKNLRVNFLAIMGLLNLGFLLFVVATSNPFDRNMTVPLDGNDLNPLLQDFGLIVHPPMLYMGYVGLSVVFSFAIACCFEDDFKKEWAQWIRPWILASWAFLTLGISLGSWWAYYELGWGGWWFWDPVENASFMPWLMATALLHSVIATSEKGIFKSWTILLSIFTFSLSLLGTFLVRSGILISVHSFASDPSRGVFILLMLIALIGGGLLAYALNSYKFKDENEVKLFSKEGFFLLNNILLVTATFTILLGTMYPLFLDILGLEKISVGVPYYNAVFVPLMIPLILLVGYIPILLSRLSKNKQLIQLVAILIISIFLSLIYNVNTILFFIGIFSATWIVGNILFDSFKSYDNKIMFRNRIGMYFAHFGLAVFIVGASVSENMKIEKEFTLDIGQSKQVGLFNYKFEKLNEYKSMNYDALIASIIVSKDDQFITEINPEKRLYHSSESPMTEAGINGRLDRDLYVSLGNMVSENKWSIRVYDKPLIRLIWIGTIFMILGAIISIRFRRSRHYE